MTDSWKTLNHALPMPGIIPHGTIAKVRLVIRRGGYNNAQRGWTGGYATLGREGAVYLNGEFTVLEGPYARRRIYSRIGLYSPRKPRWADAGRAFMRDMLNSAYGLSSRDTSPQAMAARRIAGFADLNGREFVAQIDVGKNASGEDRNEIRVAVTPDHESYAEVMRREAASTARSQPTSTLSLSSDSDPSWAR